MKAILLLVVFALLLIIFPPSAQAQTDELRQATGLPLQIGAAAVYGQVTIKRVEKSETRPRAHVTLLEGGTQLERVQTNDEGFYYFRNFPRGTATLVFEVDNAEVGRLVINPGASRTIRQDITVDWQEKKKARASVIDLKGGVEAYPRDDAGRKVLSEATQLGRDNQHGKAILILTDVVTKDPKDYVVWTELGTLYFQAKSLHSAETAYLKAIELKKDYFPALLNLGKLYINGKQFDNAILVLSNAVKSKQDSADAHHYLGEAYLNVKKGSLAVPALNEAIRLAPAEKAEIHLRLASLYDAAGMKAKASGEYKLFLAKRPDHPKREQLEKYVRDNPIK